MYYIAYFFGAIFLANSIPHTVSGMMGRPFQTPFAKPSGIGLSSSKINIYWGFLNLLVGYLLIFHVGDFDFHSFKCVAAAGFGAFFISLFSAKHFGELHGGNI